MRNPWSIVRCRLLQAHRWQTVEIDGDKGWECRDCKKHVFEREYLERVHDGSDYGSDATKHGGAAGGAGTPF